VRVGEVVRRTGVTARALRYSESIGLVVPSRWRPPIAAAGVTLHPRLNLTVSGGVIEHVFYPVPASAAHAALVPDCLRAHQEAGR
jgi:hypothetical protein